MIFIKNHSKNLIDIDECSNGQAGCNQLCTNTVPGFTCRCTGKGFTLQVDEKTCIGLIRLKAFENKIP